MQEEVTRNGRAVRVVREGEGVRIEREHIYSSIAMADRVYTLLMFDKEARAAFLRNRKARRTQL